MRPLKAIALAFVLMSIPTLAASGEQSDLQCLSLAMYHESLDQPIAGQKAIGYVILNRAEEPKFPHSVCGVIHQPGQFTGIRKRRILNWKLYNRLYSEAQEVYSDRDDSNIGKSNYFHRIDVHPRWAKRMEVVTRIGDHVFLKG